MNTGGANLVRDHRAKGKRGRKPASVSRAAEIRAKLLAWTQMPEEGRTSLRAIAREIGTSHQLLSFFLRRLDKWQAKQYQGKANDIRAYAKAEGRHLTPQEEAQMTAYVRAGFQSMISSVLAELLKRLQMDAESGKLSKGHIKIVNLLAQRGDPVAQNILQKHRQQMSDASAKVG
jgi:IS30 family transposase